MAMGFRPFFLLGSVAAVALVFLWAFFLVGFFDLAGRNMLLWHAHEMLFAFVTAIVAGFLLTATQNWTGIRGVHGKALFFLVLLWFLPRLMFFIPVMPNTFLAAVDLAFLPALAFSLKPYLDKSGRNKIFYALLTALWIGNLLWHLEILGYTSHTALEGTGLAVRTLVLMMVIIGGRIIPFFTGNAISAARIRVRPLLEKAVLITTVLFVILGTFFASHKLFAILGFVLFVLQLWRWIGWDPWASRRVPILWVLHLGYFWIVIGFWLMALTPFLSLMPSLATHTFTAGAMGVLIYGMITRVSLGHTGRPIRATPLITLGYVLVNLAALVRVLGPLLAPFYYDRILFVSAAFWVLAYGILLAVYAPLFFQVRADGREG